MKIASREQSVGYWAHRIAGRAHQRMSERLEEIGLSGAEGFMLMSLQEDGGAPVSEIARKLRHSHPSVIRLVDQLEEKGLVQRSPHQSDRRIKIVSLTELGAAMVPKLVERMVSVHEEMAQALTERQYKTLLDLMKKLDAGLGPRDGC